MKTGAFSKIKYLAPYMGLALIIVLPWFLRSGYIFLTDMDAGPHIIIPKFAVGGFFYYHLIAKILSFVLPGDLIQKLLIAVILGVVLLGGYKTAKVFTQNKAILFLGSAFTLFNPFVYDRLMYGQIGVILAYGFFLCAGAYLLAYYFNPVNRRLLLLAGVFAGLSVLFSQHFIFFIGFLYLVFGVLTISQFLFLGGLHKCQRQSLKIVLWFILSFLIILAVNFNWLWAVFFQSSQVSQTISQTITLKDLEAFKTAGKSEFEVVENVALMSGFWGLEQSRYDNLQSVKGNWGRSFYFLLPIIILGLIVGLKGKGKRGLSIGLIIIYIVAFILALGIALPITSKVTLWFFNNIPFYKGLREPQKWVAIMVFVYQIFLVSGLVSLSKKKILARNKQAAMSLMVLVILMQAPLLVWGGAGQVKAVNYPRDWYDVNNLIVKEQSCQNKVLFLPWHGYLYFKWIGRIVANPSARFFQCEVFYGKNMEFAGIFGHSLNPAEKEIEQWLFSYGRHELFYKNQLNIGYIVLAKEADWQNYLWIENHPNIVLVKETVNLKVYQVLPAKK